MIGCQYVVNPLCKNKVSFNLKKNHFRIGLLFNWLICLLKNVIKMSSVLIICLYYHFFLCF